MEEFKVSYNNLFDKLSGWVDAIFVNLPNIILALFVALLTFYLSRVIKKYVKKLIAKATANRTLTGVISNMITAAFIIVMFVVVLSILNLSTAVASILGAAGVMGLAVGLALQDPIINLFSGVLMSVRAYYQVGDLVKTNDFFGTIYQINLRSTILQTPDGQEVIIPNKDVLQNPLINFSHNGRRRVDIKCGISYGDDLELVQKVAVSAIESNLDFNDNLPVEFFYTEFGDNSINFVLRFWHQTTNQRDYLEGIHKGIIALKKAFDKEGISIPFPITTLDFGVSGGLAINDIYPADRLLSKKNTQQNLGQIP